MTQPSPAAQAAAEAAHLPEILIVDDEPVICRLVSYIVREAELGRPRVCGDSREVLDILAAAPVGAVLLDLNMPWLNGQDLLEAIARDYPDLPVVILTNEDRLEVAVECLRRGAFDFMTKPIDRNRLISAVRHALTIRELRREVNVLSAPREDRPLRQPEAFAGIITRSRVMQGLFAHIETIAPSPKAVLVTGESGTGKELIANVIHKLSGRTGAFVAINVSGLDDTVFSDSLFGHLKGSYTGADGARRGLVEQARDGTLFLDEIGDLETGPQIKLLRLLQEGDYYPLGSDAPMRSRARIVAATNASLAERQESGLFRRDLYYRLIAHHIEIPPLRERPEDIEPLFAHFVAEAARTLGVPEPVTPDFATRLLLGHDWPGNVRELQGLAFDAVSRSRGGAIDVGVVRHHVGAGLASTGSEPAAAPASPAAAPLASPAVARHAPGPDARDEHILAGGCPESGDAIRGPGEFWVGASLPQLDEVVDFLYAEALRRSAGNQSAAATLLGVSQPTLSRWVAKRREAGRAGGNSEG